jgi:hypothetical protein
MAKQTEVEAIWKEAERRLGTDRSNLSLVRNSHYLQAEGILEQPEQIFEVRWRGRAGSPVGEGKAGAGSLQEMAKVQYRLEKGGEIKTMWMPTESDVGYVRRELQKRHPDRTIERLYQAGGQLAEEDPIYDWKTSTGSRFQVTIGLQDEMREDEGKEEESSDSMIMEPEKTSSSEEEVKREPGMAESTKPEEEEAGEG